ncbi:metallopeptidase TldD-related protein [Quadrisphaera sp. GCM10027208]|uniref:metallopeptidase TldD-related protein n=1 Tax=Quadrisphaera sp. GCM10027208 TaxID=3273423 RepID=UPI003612654B
MSRPSTAPDVVEKALATAQASPAHAGTCVVVREESGVNLRWAANTLTTNGVTSGQSVTVAAAVRTAAGVSVGVLTRRGVGADDVAALVEDAQAAAATAPPAEDAADLVTGQTGPDWMEPAPATGPDVLAGFAEGLGEALARARGQGRELFGFAEHGVRTTWLGTTAGTRRRHVQPQGTVELTGKSHDRARSTYVGRATRDFTDVDAAALDAEIEQRLAWQARRVDVPAGRYDTVLPPTAVADLMVYAYWSSDARSAHEGRSVFSRRGGGTRVGDRLTDVPLTLYSDPAEPGLETEPFVLTEASSPFASGFDNGMPVGRSTWIEDGVLAALPTTRHTAALTGLPVQPAVDNLVLTGRDASGDLADVVRGVDRGLLVTCLWYIREVDPTTLLLTGLTRDGVYLVEGGEVTGAVTNFRFNESPVGMLGRVGAVGRTEPALSREWGDYFPRTAMPPLLVHDLNMSSTSQAS